MRNSVERMVTTGGSDTENNYISSKKEGNRSQRIAANKEKFQEQYNMFDENEPILHKAQELLDTYGSSEKIPEEVLDIDESGFDDARLLRMAQLLEKQ